jgi:hypothetical protein
VSIEWSETTNMTVRSQSPRAFWLATKRDSCWSAIAIAWSYAPEVVPNACPAESTVGRFTKVRFGRLRAPSASTPSSTVRSTTSMTSWSVTA